MARRRVLVCGATGFIGRNVAESLAGRDDLEVVGTYLDSPPYEHPGLALVHVDLTDAKEVDGLLAGFDVVVQAAATTSGAKDAFEKPYYHVTDNAVMNSLIFRAAHERQVSHVVFFSCTVMLPSGERPLNETDYNADLPPHPRYFGVGLTKVYLENMCEFFSRLGRTRFTAIRHTNIYGPHDKFDLERSHVFGATVAKVMTVANGRIVVWGDGSEERDLLYVSDLVDFVRLVIDNQSEPFGLYNVAYGRSTPIRELVREISEVSGRDLAVEHDLGKPSIKTKVTLDTAKARRDFGWTPRVSLREGIAKTLQWYQANIAQ